MTAARSARKKSSAKNNKLLATDSFVDSLSGITLLGELIGWEMGEGTKTHPEVVEALKSSELDERVAKELLPRFAFSRAAKKLADERLIDIVNEDGDEIKFQITKRLNSGDELTFERETFLHLNKTTGRIECDSEQLKERAQTALDKAIVDRTTSDITKIVQRLFDNHADLMPFFKKKGGVYIVPIEHTTFVSKISAFLTKMGGVIKRVPIPSGTALGDRTMQETVEEYLDSLMMEHDSSIEEFGLDTRPDTLEKTAAKIKSTRTKIEAYAHYLTERKEVLLKKVEDATAKLVKRVEEISKERETRPASETTGTRGYIFGWSVTAVLRWMGKAKWSSKQARKVLNAHGCADISDATISAQLPAGRKGLRGDPAKLTPEQAAQLEAARDGEVVEQEEKSETKEEE